MTVWLFVPQIQFFSLVFYDSYFWHACSQANFRCWLFLIQLQSSFSFFSSSRNNLSASLRNARKGWAGCWIVCSRFLSCDSTRCSRPLCRNIKSKPLPHQNLNSAAFVRICHWWWAWSFPLPWWQKSIMLMIQGGDQRAPAPLTFTNVRCLAQKLSLSLVRKFK